MGRLRIGRGKRATGRSLSFYNHVDVVVTNVEFFSDSTKFKIMERTSPC